MPVVPESITNRMRPQTKKKKRTFKQWVVFVFALFFGAFLGFAIEHARPDGDPVGPLTLLICFLAGIFIHELGHVVGAVSVRFRVTTFTVGPLMLQKGPTGIRFRRAQFRLGGLVTAVPVGTESLPRRMLIMTAAGPIASLLSALLAFVLVRAMNEGGWSDWLLLYAINSAGLGVLSLMPMRRFYLSDGARIWEIFRSPEKTERRVAMLTILEAATNAGTRPREWDTALLAKALALTDGSGSDVGANLLAYESAMDLGDFERAEKHLEAAAGMLHQCPVNVKTGIALDAAFFYSMVREDKAVAREWLNACNRRYINERYSLLMTEAAVLLAEGKWNEASCKAEEAMKALPEAQYPGFASAAKDWLTVILKRAQTPTAVSTVHSTVN